MCDRSLATAVLFDQCPEGNSATAVKALAECPPSMGFSYPANAGWRFWSLAKARRGDLIVPELRKRWASMTSVIENNTLQEDWDARHDSGQQWSHCAVVPLYIAFHGLLGLKPLLPGFRKFELAPQVGDLEALELTAFTVRGPLRFQSKGLKEERQITLELPPDGVGELVVDARESIDLPSAPGPVPASCRRYQLPHGSQLSLRLRYS